MTPKKQIVHNDTLFFFANQQGYEKNEMDND